MPKIKRHAQKNDTYSAMVELQLLAQTKLTVVKLHDTGEVMLDVATAKFVKGLFFATEVLTRISLTKAEAQELFAAIGYCLKAKPKVTK